MDRDAARVVLLSRAQLLLGKLAPLWSPLHLICAGQQGLLLQTDKLNSQAGC